MGTNHAQETCQERQLQLQEENEYLKRENEYLKRSLLRFQNIAKDYESKKLTVLALEAVNKVLTEQNKELKRKMVDLKRLVGKQTEEIKLIEEKNQDYKDRLDGLLLELQQDGQLCVKNCALCALLKICEKKLGYSPCGPQLALIILNKLPRDEIAKEDLRCEKMLDLLEKGKIVDVKSEYFYPDSEIAKLQTMDNVWDELMTMTEKECILGLKSAKAPGGGHCVVLDLESRNNGTVKVYDPQAADLKEANMNRDAFINYVKDGEGIRLYTLDFKTIEDTLYDVQDILHVNDAERFFFLSMAV